MFKLTVLQDGIKECGSACILSILRYYKGNIPINDLLELTHTNKDGTNFYEMSKACYELGFTSNAYKIDNIDSLNNYKLPLISQVIVDNLNHFVVIYKIKKDTITIMDPAKGMRNITKKEFNIYFQGYILTLTPYKELPRYNPKNYIKELIIKTINSNKKLVFNLIIITLISMFLTCIYSYYTEYCLNKIILSDKYKLIITFIIFMIILFIKCFIEYLRNLLIIKINNKIDLSIINNTIKKIIYLPFSYYKNRTSGEIISKINDLLYIKNIITKLILSFSLDLVLSIGVFIILFKIDKTMTLFLILIICIYLIIVLLTSKYNKEMTSIVQENNSKLYTNLIETINGYNSVKGLNLESNFYNKIKTEYTDSIKDSTDYSKYELTEDLLVNIFEGLIILLIFTIGIFKIMDKSLSIGSFITYSSIMYLFINPIKENIFMYKDLYYVKLSINKINNILNVSNDDNKSITNFIRGNIYINNLIFSYSNKKEVLKNISLIFGKKEKVLILGESGSGKSTLLKLLFKYYKVENNMINIGKIDINNVSVNDIRNNMLYVSQNEVIYTDTILNNIILNRNIDLSSIEEIIKLTCIDTFLKEKNIDVNYLLLENGSNLSGGQVQRIILARSFIEKKNYYLLDESTNQIDINLERKILKNIFNKYESCFIMVSHRKENMDLFDKVIVMNEGKVKDVIEKVN